MKIGFDHEKYLEEQSKYILERVNNYDKLYLEFGGKLLFDLHAKRVLPGFDENAKIKLLHKLRENVEVVICVYAGDIERNKIRGDFGITYDMDVMRLIDDLRSYDLEVNSVVITRYNDQPSATVFINKLERRGIKVYKHRATKGYPTDVDTIVSDEGYGKNPYIETSKPIVVVTAPGPGSGKLATCLSQLYHEYKRGNAAGYSKFETFPVWNVPLKHPLNIAYEAATVDLKDASRKEIIRRYFKTGCEYKKGYVDKETFEAAKLIMEQVNLKEEDRKVVLPARKRAEELKETVGKNEIVPVIALELADGTIITGRSTETLDSSASVLVNAIKHLANISDDIHLISPVILEPINKLKSETLSSKNVALNCEEVLIALSICAATNPMAQAAMEKLPMLKGGQAHSTIILPTNDEQTFRKLGIDITCDAVYPSESLYY